MPASLRDILTRGILCETPRRVLFRALSGISLTSLPAVLVAYRNADARKRKRRKKKCKGGKKKCGKKCFDLQTDPLHCGSCGNHCDGNRECVAGICSCPQGECCADADCGDGGKCGDGTCFCSVDKTSCGGTCVDLATDGANCGACGTACDTNGCVNGFCTCQSQDDCNGCVCSLRLEDSETACSGDLTAQSCTVDADCPARSFCRQTGGGNFCTELCPA